MNIFLSKLRAVSNNDIVHNLYLMFGHCLRSADVVVQADIVKTKVSRRVFSSLLP